MNIHDLFPSEDFQEALDGGFVGRQFHPEWDLEIYNYTPATQFSRNWNPVTMACRGLIVDFNGDLVARPWAKFFNHTETAVPKYALTTPPVVMSKADGSLGIIHQTPDGRFAVATRGSFRSDQAIWATQWLTLEMPEYRQPDTVTTLVEIIYPQNRIVVNYGDRAELVLLGAVDNRTGADIPMWEIDWWPGERVEQLLGLGLMDDVNRHVLQAERPGDEDEGVVAVWYRPNEPSFRLKVKGLDYIRLHRIITGFNTKTVWESLSRGEDFEELLERVPDEFYGWVKGTVAKLRREFSEVEQEAIRQYRMVMAKAGREDRKAFALEAKKMPLSGLIFAMLDGKNYDAAIWSMIRPVAERPFANDEEI